MKTITYLIAILLTATTLLAGDYAVVLVNEDVPLDRKAIVLEYIREAGGDTNLVDWDGMPQWYNKADTNLLYRIVCIRTDTLGVKCWKELPLEQVETRVTKDVRPPDKQKILVRQKMKVITREALVQDYEPVETGIPE